MLEIQEPFRIRLEKAMALRNMKAIDLVRKTKISESVISQYRSGKIEPKRDKLMLIAKALSVNPAWLMGLDVKMEESQILFDSYKVKMGYEGTNYILSLSPEIELDINMNSPTPDSLIKIFHYMSKLNAQGIDTLEKYLKMMMYSDEYRKDGGSDETS